jgi:hypothetical protein
MLVLLYRERLETALVHMSGAGRSAMGMPALGVCQRYPRHETRKIPIARWPKHEMPVIGHEAVREYSHCPSRVRFPYHPLERREIAWLLEYRPARIGAIEDMVDHVSGSRAQ